jgi:hypothetical protein
VVGVDLNQIAISALAESLEGLVPSDKIVTKYLRKLGRSVNNHQRATLARRILGTSVLRQRLSFIADFLNASATVPSRQDGREQHRAAELLALYILHEEHRVMAGQETFDDAEMTKGDAELGRDAQEGCLDADTSPDILKLLKLSILILILTLHTHTSCRMMPRICHLSSLCNHHSHLRHCRLYMKPLWRKSCSFYPANVHLKWHAWTCNERYTCRSDKTACIAPKKSLKESLNRALLA